VDINGNGFWIIDGQSFGPRERRIQLYGATNSLQGELQKEKRLGWKRKRNVENYRIIDLGLSMGNNVVIGSGDLVKNNDLFTIHDQQWPLFVVVLSLCQYNDTRSATELLSSTLTLVLHVSEMKCSQI
jgi:hypothetical protein